MANQTWPTNVGIVAIELIFPSQYVDQTELEQYDGVSTGKYTVGLGQSKMGFCSDREDIHSLCLTVVQKLLDTNNIKHSEIGRLEVGTETIIDKSKSVKSVLMQLFEPHGVTDLEGIDTTNACYGGTAALFNAVSWVESSYWDGRYALVVCGDIAVYAKGAARPTGGAGAVAMLVGANAPLVLDRGLRATFMRHCYDFYKPDLSSEYPTVDGKLSIQCYLGALDHCYQLYCSKAAKLNQTINIDSFNALVFHSPYCKLVQKSLARLVLNDFVRAPTDPKFPSSFEKFANVKLHDTYFDRDIEKAFMDQSREVFEAKTKPSLFVANQVGNMYTPSVYGGLISLLMSKSAEQLAGNKVAMFSYGSGLASTFYSLTISNDVSPNSPLRRMVDNLKQVKKRLEQRRCVRPEVFTKIMEQRSLHTHDAPYEPSGSVDDLFPGTFYLDGVDDMHRRTYKRNVYTNGVNGS